MSDKQFTNKAMKVLLDSWYIYSKSGDSIFDGRHILLYFLTKFREESSESLIEFEGKLMKDLRSLINSFKYTGDLRAELIACGQPTGGDRLASEDIDKMCDKIVERLEAEDMTAEFMPVNAFSVLVIALNAIRDYPPQIAALASKLYVAMGKRYSILNLCRGREIMPKNSLIDEFLEEADKLSLGNNDEDDDEIVNEDDEDEDAEWGEIDDDEDNDEDEETDGEKGEDKGGINLDPVRQAIKDRIRKAREELSKESKDDEDDENDDDEDDEDVDDEEEDDVFDIEDFESLLSDATNPTIEERIEELRKRKEQRDNKGADGDDSDDEGPKLEQIVNSARNMSDFLRKKVFGQEVAIQTFVEGWFKACLEEEPVDGKKRTTPRALFLFAGPPGVGKTYMAECAAEYLKLPFKRFDMSGYIDREAAVNNFIGINPSYKSADEGEVTGFVRKNPKCLLLFDEIEKAHSYIINLFLQMLDSGKLKDAFTAKDVDFTQTIIIMTTNAGRALYEEASSLNLSTLPRKAILDAIKAEKSPNDAKVDAFPSPIISRFSMGNVVMLNHLPVENLEAIVKREIDKSVKQMEAVFNVEVEYDDRLPAIMLFSEGGLTDARAVKGQAPIKLVNEIFELVRLYSDDSDRLQRLKKIKLGIAENEDNKRMLDKIFKKKDKNTVVLLVNPEKKALLKPAKGLDVRLFDNNSEALEFIQHNEVDIVAADISCGILDESTFNYGNLEDIKSHGVLLINRLLDSNPEMPIYLLETDEFELYSETELSFLRKGIRGKLSIKKEDADELSAQLNTICVHAGLQQFAYELASAGKTISYRSAQLIEPDGEGEAQILLYDLRIHRAISVDTEHKLINDVEKPNVKMDDVIGARDAKEELTKLTGFLLEPARCLREGKRAPRGVLLYGPPGTGKTMIAKALAGTTDVAFISTNGSSFLNKFVGESAASVRKLFATARKYAPAIVFIDEIDIVGKKRSADGNDNGNDQVLNALLVEMDGFDFDPKKPVFVLAATNMPIEGRENVFDEALLRRFDRKILVDLPATSDRLEYLKRCKSKHKLENVTDALLDGLAVRSVGCSLAKLENVINAVLYSVTSSAEVTDAMLSEAFEKQLYGEQKTSDKAELRKTAVHESGHAVISYLGGNVPIYLTIVSRGNMGGYMQRKTDENKGTYSEEELRAFIRSSLAGRAAELEYFDGEGSNTGASGDLRNATSIAFDMVSIYGMSGKLGLASFDRAILAASPYFTNIVGEVNSLLAEEMEKTRLAIRDNRAAIDVLVNELLSKNRLEKDELYSLLEKNVCKDGKWGFVARKAKDPEGSDQD